MLAGVALEEMLARGFMTVRDAGVSGPATHGATACEGCDGVRGPPLPGQPSVWSLAVGRLVHVTVIGDFVASGNDCLAHCGVAFHAPARDEERAVDPDLCASADDVWYGDLVVAQGKRVWRTARRHGRRAAGAACCRHRRPSR